MMRALRVFAMTVGLAWLAFALPQPSYADPPGKKPKASESRKRANGASSARPAKGRAQKERKRRAERPRPERETKPSEARPARAEREAAPRPAEEPARSPAQDAARAAQEAAQGVESQIVKEGDTSVKVMNFSGLDIEGRLKSPQLLYFVNRVHAEFERPKLPHRSFMPELEKSTHRDPFP